VAVSRIDRTRDAVREVVALAQREQLTFLAAAIAYYGFVSLVPLLLLVLVVGSVLGDEALATAIVERAGAILSPTGKDLLSDALTGASGRGGATVVGLGVLVWSVLKVFRGLDKAFARLYGTAGEHTIVDELRDGVIVLGSAALGLGGLSVVVGVATVVSGPLVRVFAPFGLFVSLLIAFFPLYYVFPDASMRARDAFPGTLVAAAGWVVLASAFSLYAEVAGSFALYGVLGAALLVVTFLYFGSILLLVGAAVNATLAGLPSTGNFNTQTGET